MINGISPANRNVISNQRPNNNQNNPKTKLTETSIDNPMSLEKTNDKSFLDKIKANKKLLIAGAVGLVAITGALIYGIKKGIIFKGKIKLGKD